MPTWFFLLLLGLGGLLLPMIGFQFLILNLLGPATPVVSVLLLVASVVLFLRGRRTAVQDEESP